ncbi:hypothetical protein D3C71_2012140 [compost metagenome]
MVPRKIASGTDQITLATINSTVAPITETISSETSCPEIMERPRSRWAKRQRYRANW